MTSVEKLDLLAESQNINISTNTGKHDVLQFILSRLSLKEIEEFYIDTFMMLDDEICELYDEEIEEEETEEDKHQNMLDDIGDQKYQQWKDEGGRSD